MARAWSSSAGLQLCVFALAVCARLAYLFRFRPTIESAYWSISEHLARTGRLALNGAAVSDYEPLYLIFLAAARTLTGDRVFLVQILQVGLASLGAVFLYRLSFALTGSMRVATIAGALFAVHPLLVRQASAATDLWLATTLLVAFAWAFVTMRGTADAAVAGGWIGLAVLTRSMTLPVLAGGVALLLATRRIALVMPFVAASLLLIAPFAVRNYQVSGSWWPTRSGMALYVGNSPYSAALLPPEDLDLLQEMAAVQIARERPDLSPDAPEYPAAIDAFLTRRAVDYMMERPFLTLGQKLLNVAYLFSPTLVPSRIATPDTTVTIDPRGAAIVERSVPRPRVETIAHGVATTVILVTAAIGMYLRRRQLGDDALLWIVAAVFIVVNAVYVPATRYMAPMLFVMLFYSAVSLSQKRYR
jgi:hypothetical protein